ncbi:MAG: ionic transporter y4hA [Beijerinckiaceae bacterium]|nr:ionic transporter y4hA [Beijerinckiaceae bacterium]
MRLLFSPQTIPFLALAFLGVARLAGLGTAGDEPASLAFTGLLLPVLLATVFAAVHHAEEIAHKTGEPYGTLVLTAAVTVIEVSLIAFLMLGEGSSPTLARDTVFSVIMIVCNGIVGLCTTVGGLKYGEQGFRTRGTAAYLMVLSVLATLALILPNHTVTTSSPTFSLVQLIFVSLATIILYATFVYIQTVRHSDLFIEEPKEDAEGGTFGGHSKSIAQDIFFLVAALLAVILMAESFAHGIETVLHKIGAPPAVTGVIIALLVLLPEGVAALIAARRDELQKSVNLALGSSLATIGLTIPSVAILSVILGTPIILGLPPRDVVLLVLTLIVSQLTFGSGRTNVLNGIVHLVIFASFLVFTILP